MFIPPTHISFIYGLICFYTFGFTYEENIHQDAFDFSVNDRNIKPVQELKKGSGESDTIKIGANLELSGAVASYGESLSEGNNMTVEEINKDKMVE
jgi:ABC-type branched-subunit amino acid transport system substrate-binding protein